MANQHTTLVSLFDDIADAIRAKTGGTALIIADDFPDAIMEIPTGGGGQSPHAYPVSRYAESSLNANWPVTATDVTP